MMQNLHRRLARNRRTASKHVIENCAEAVDVGAAGNGARVRRLFRRHVIRRPENGEGLRKIALTLQPFRKTEIAYEWFPSRIEKHVSGFEIAMQNSMLMCERDRARKFGDEGCGFARFIAIVVDLRGQGAAFGELHTVKWGAV